MHPVRRRHPRTAAVTAAAVLSALLLGGCGASEGDEPEPGAEPAPGISVPADLLIDGRTASGEASADVSAAPDASPEPSASAASGEPSAEPPAAEDAAAACADLQTAWAGTNRALVGLSPEHPRSLVASFREAHRSITSVEPTPDIEEAWTAMTDYLGSAVDAFQDVDADDAAAVSAALTEAITSADTARATAASEEITAYVADSCAAR
ncbi:hypothetical protein [Isoptericola variabilis]|nr:hypothetical protein [Isoptericola variabilis]